MKERFKSYLEQAFRKIRPTKAAMEYRLETLTKLEEAAQDYRIKGMTDDEAIYQLCIDSLGDFDAKLQEFDRNLTEVPKKNNLKRNIAVGAIGSVAAIIALYLILSLTGAVGWGMSWLILLGAVVAAVVAVDVVLMLKAFKDDKFLVVSLHTPFGTPRIRLVYLPLHGPRGGNNGYRHRLCDKEQADDPRNIRLGDADVGNAVRYVGSRRSHGLASRLVVARPDRDRNSRNSRFVVDLAQ